MWLLRHFLNPAQEQAEVGVLTDNEAVRGASVFAQTVQCGPWGIRWRAPEGAKSVLLPTDAGTVCLGTESETQGLQPGELLLTALGGAQIYLKADGTVWINGQCFPRQKEA